MLVLARRLGESIIIGEGPNKITVTLLERHGHGLKIGINAPRNIPVHREEIYKQIYKKSKEEGMVFDTN